MAASRLTLLLAAIIASCSSLAGAATVTTTVRAASPPNVFPQIAAFKPFQWRARAVGVVNGSALPPDANVSFASWGSRPPGSGTAARSNVLTCTGSAWSRGDGVYNASDMEMQAIGMPAMLMLPEHLPFFTTGIRVSATVNTTLPPSKTSPIVGSSTLAAARSIPVTGRAVDAVVHFEGGADLAALVGQTVALNFTVHSGAIVFAFDFASDATRPLKSDDDTASRASVKTDSRANGQRPANPVDIQISFEPPVLISNRSTYADYSTQIDNQTLLFQASVNGLRRPDNDTVSVTVDGGRSWTRGWEVGFANATRRSGLIDTVVGQLIPVDDATASSMGFITAVRDMADCPGENVSEPSPGHISCTTPPGMYRKFTNRFSNNPTTYFGVFPNRSVGRIQRHETVQFDLGPDHEVNYHGHTSLPPLMTCESGLIIRPDDDHAVKTAWIVSAHAPAVWFSVIAFVAPPPFLNFSFLGVVANASEGIAGVDEHDIALLPNGTSIVAILRTNGPDYLQKLSHDGGRSWVNGASMVGIGSVCPRLLMMPDKPLLLSGGRGKYSGDSATPNSISYDNQLWVNCKPEHSLAASSWQRVSISAWHNYGEPTGDPTRRFTSAVNSSSMQSNSYNTLHATGGPGEAIIICECV